MNFTQYKCECEQGTEQNGNICTKKVGEGAACDNQFDFCNDDLRCVNGMYMQNLFS